MSVIELLECRLLRAAGSGVTYRLADYLPTTDGLIWNYTGTHTINAEQENESSSNASLVITFTHDANGRLSNAKLTDIDGLSTSDTRITADDDNGLEGASVSERLPSGDTVQIDREIPAEHLGTMVQIGDEAGGKKLVVTEKLTTGGATYTLTGHEDRLIAVTGYEVVTLPDGRFVYALKLETKRTREVEGRIRGKFEAITDLIGVTQWFAKGIGLVKSHTRESYGISDGQQQVATGDTADDFTLASSPLLPTIKPALSAQGVVTLAGTPARDDIELDEEKRQLLVYTSGVGTLFDLKKVTGIEIATGDGNDQVVLNQSRGAYVDAGAGNDVVRGGPGTDTLTGGAGKDSLDGGAGDDRVAGNGGHDALVGGEGNDRVYGGNENDTLEGGGGVDRLWGGEGDDLLSGGSSNDKLYGEDGNDQLYGGTQNDYLIGGAGIDTLDGGDGADTTTPDPADMLSNM